MKNDEMSELCASLRGSGSSFVRKFLPSVCLNWLMPLSHHCPNPDNGIKCKPITVHNPQANATVECVHQVIGNMIRTYELEDNYLDENDPWGGILSATAFAVPSTYHTTLKINCQLQVKPTTQSSVKS